MHKTSRALPTASEDSEQQSCLRAGQYSDLKRVEAAECAIQDTMLLYSVLAKIEGLYLLVVIVQRWACWARRTVLRPGLSVLPLMPHQAKDIVSSFLSSHALYCSFRFASSMVSLQIGLPGDPLCHQQSFSDKMQAAFHVSEALSSV